VAGTDDLVADATVPILSLSGHWALCGQQTWLARAVIKFSASPPPGGIDLRELTSLVGRDRAVQVTY
jgi:hypothetical protein